MWDLRELGKAVDVRDGGGDLLIRAVVQREGSAPKQLVRLGVHLLQHDVSKGVCDLQRAGDRAFLVDLDVVDRGVERLAAGGFGLLVGMVSVLSVPRADVSAGVEAAAPVDDHIGG